MALTKIERETIAGALARLPDEVVSAPLWEFAPESAPFVLSERRRRNILQIDPEPIGDSEYS